MQTVFDRTDCQNLKRALSKEWLETNGLGGFATSTIIGTNTRRQHGLLVAALNPPSERYVLVAKLEERVLVDGHEAFISTNLYPGTVYPQGFNIQTEFRLHPWPTFRYAQADFELEKSVCLVQGENTLVVGYHNRRSVGPLDLKLCPLLAFRPINADLGRRRDDLDLTVARTEGGWSVQPYPKQPRLHFYAHPEAVDSKADWYYRFTYPQEQERGLDCEEDLFTPLEMTFRIPAGETAFIVISTENKPAVDAPALVEQEQQRRSRFEREHDPIRQALAIAADAYLVRRGSEDLTVLAGYPWFADRGRDALIALPGLTLATGRGDAAGQILQTMARSCDRGLVANVFPEGREAPQSNSVDASLWLALATWKYWKASGDHEGARRLLPVLAEVIKYYREGTRCDIRADRDGLLVAGAPNAPLTWMDVNAEGYVPTPRNGKAVEVNALWLNALRMVAEMEEKLSRDVHATAILRKLADQVAGSFVKTFWYREGGYLFDCVQGDARDVSVRPNQILAISLPYTALDQAQQQSVLNVVTKHLLTPYGLRTLSPQHERYVGRYAGNRWQRDCAYHQGTVWPWLIGPYCDAYARVNGSSRTHRKEIARFLQPLLGRLEEGCLGHISEIFEGDAPHRPVGCVAMAWSVAEVLRVYDAYLK